MFLCFGVYLSGSLVIGCVYKDLHELLQTNQGGGDKTEPTKCILYSMFALLKSRWLLAPNGLYRYVNTRITTAAVDPILKRIFLA